MATDYTKMPTDQLLAENSRLSGCLSRAKDTLSIMLLTGLVKAVMREIETRQINAAVASKLAKSVRIMGEPLVTAIIVPKQF